MKIPESEKYRPRFHFTAKKGWLNDPVGLVFYGGEYHLFFQHDPDPRGRVGKNMIWGHAVSRDLARWKELAPALEIDPEFGQNYSGSGVVDFNNNAGFPRGREKNLLIFFTAAGKKGFCQCCAYSNDRGRTWTRHKGNPILPEISKGNRDPRVFWHEESGKWIMLLWMKRGYGFFSSKDLKNWKTESHIKGFFECPDLFPLKAGKEKKWVLVNGDGNYKTGNFDGKTFFPQTAVKTADYGGQIYATQTWNNAPRGRRIQVGWMRGGKFPGMPFNQQMSFPCELNLVKTRGETNLVKTPVPEIKKFREAVFSRRDFRVNSRRPFSAETGSDILDVFFEIETGGRSKTEILLCGIKMVYSAAAKTLRIAGKTMPLPPDGGKINARILLDRASVEIFAVGGTRNMSLCFPREIRTGARISCREGSIRVLSLKIHRIKL